MLGGPGGRARLASPADPTETLDATPLTQLLTESDLERLPGDRAAVAAWCGRWLLRPADLTAGPSFVCRASST